MKTIYYLTINVFKIIKCLLKFYYKLLVTTNKVYNYYNYIIILLYIGGIDKDLGTCVISNTENGE